MQIQSSRRVTSIPAAMAALTLSITFTITEACAADNEELAQRITALEQQLKLQQTEVGTTDKKQVDAPLYPSVKLFGYTQFGATFGSAATPHQFAFDRVRLGAKGNINEKIGYRVMLELLKLNSPARGNTTAEGLLDAMLTYKVMPGMKLSAGQFKTPFSMAYTTSASKLDVIGFGMATNVSLDRAVGLMASGRNLLDSGLGYDIGIFNAGTRATGTSYSAGTLGHDDMVTGRLLFDGFNKGVHLEAGAVHAGVTGGLAYAAGFTALRLRYQPLEVKAEYLQGRQGTRRTTVVYGQLLATVLEHYELVGKWERTHLTDTGVNLTADNLILGINVALYPDKPQRARMQLNYVIASRDAKSLGTLVGFRKGYTDNQFKLQIQAGF